ncbi:protein kinase domain-containing protein [Scytonema sp. PRP1]|uniref:protein kinase domain-containing protein n=1 Tax=Scytonema sp. PRP1 TaxID=3120513 RepID=UPI002FD6BA20
MILQSNDYNDNAQINRYSFKDQESDQIFYLEVDKNNEPIKLGDGTFGVVFAASNRVNDKLAVKILYEYSAPGVSNENPESILEKENTKSTPDGIKERFESEIQSTKHILELSPDSKLTRVIKIVGWTREFKESELYQELKSKFSSLNLSNYALVTERYDSTLKNLLEGGIGKFIELPSGSKLLNSRKKSEEEKQKKSGTNEEKKIKYELTGYDILRQMTFEDRIATILPYLLDIAQGLETIHKADLYHLDLKPANIFVKSDGLEVKSVIGDLGFLYTGEQPRFEALPVANLQLPLGTRHYRSPEQKDYFDICDVEVEVCNHNEDNCDVKLITYDPKLRDTIIENDDYIVFSKNRKAYRIQSIVIDNKTDNENPAICITLNTKINDLSNDKKTQVILYKMQTIRTDLFGFGAIVYDLITCGESPERFYENIRVIYDQEGKNVKDIMEDYLKLSDFQSSEPSLVQVFEPFKLNKSSSSYAPSDIVEIILQCMLYKVDNTFYSLSKANNPEHKPKNAVGILLESLLKITEDRGGKYKVRNRNNPLFVREWNNAKSSQDIGFLETIKELQNMQADKLWERFGKGFWYFEQISKLVEELLNFQDESSNFSFSELLPTNFAISKRNNLPNALNLKFKLYKTKTFYERDLRSDFVYTKVTRDIGNPFVPNYLTFMRRKILLIKNGSNEKITYKFLDSSPYGDVIGEDDWIILKSKNSNNLLLKVVRISNNNTIDNVHLVSSDKSTTEPINIKDHISNSEECIYYKYIDPCVYYLNMIGIYIYQIFFVNLDKNTQSKPYITDLINSDINRLKIKNQNVEIKIKIKEKPVVEESFKKFFLKQRSDQDQKIFNFQEVIRIIVSIYLKLTFTESEDSYYKKGDHDTSRMDLLFKDIKKLREAIDKATNIDIRKYPDFTFPTFKDEFKSILKPFNEMTLDLIEVNEKN